MRRLQTDVVVEVIIFGSFLEALYRFNSVYFLMADFNKMQDNPQNYDIEELTGNESEVIEMVIKFLILFYESTCYLPISVNFVYIFLLQTWILFHLERYT